MLIDAHSGGQLKFFNTHAGLADKRTFKKFLAPLRRIKCRVGGDVAIPTPHRAGRANFQHPVPHGRALLAVAYRRWTIRAGGRGWRLRIALRRPHWNTPWRSRRDNHFLQTTTT
jgi:hypothetical protein